MRTILTDYTEAINLIEPKNWILAVRKEFDPLVKDNTFEWQKAPRNKNIVGSRCFFFYYKLTTNMASIRLLLQIAAQYELLIHPKDVKSAYLNVPLDNEIYVEPPKDFTGKNGNHVWKLKKSYMLKQSGQTWNKTFHTYLTTQNFVQSPVDPCKYVQNVHNQISIILLWVDDILIVSKTEADLMKIKTKLNTRFKMTDLGKLSWFLGI